MEKDMQANICKLHSFTFVYNVEEYTSILADISHF